MRKALIIGVAGQDGIYLAELLLRRSYEVHGIKKHNFLFIYIRSVFSCEPAYTGHICFYLQYADVNNKVILSRIMREIEPDEIYNLGAPAFASFETSEQVAESNTLHTLRILEPVCVAGLIYKTRIYQSVIQNTNEWEYMQESQHSNDIKSITAKLSTYTVLSRYRSAYNLYACNGVVANYELLRRSKIFLIRKITQSTVRTVLGLQGLLYLDSLDTYRDWGHAQNYVEAMWRVLKHPVPANFVIATGIFTTVREFIRLVFAELSIGIVFQGEGVRETGYVAACYNSAFSLMLGQSIVAIDPIYYCSSNVKTYLAEGSIARCQLGWQPCHNIRTLALKKVHYDLHLFQSQSSLANLTASALSSVT